MKNFGRNGESGVSLVEILIILVVLGILVTMAIARFGTSTENLKRQNIAREFKVNLERARFDSVKRRASVCSDMSSVTINSATSFSASTDLNQNGRLDLPDETRTVDFSNRTDVTVIGNGVTLPVTIRFDERGRAFLRNDCDPASIPTATVPLFYFCNGTCTVATANAQNANAIFISPTGTVAMMTGNSTVPTFSDPAVTNINAGSGVDGRLTNWTGSPPSPTPFPRLGQYQTAGVIEKEIGGEVKEHRFVRAETHSSHEEAVAYSIVKAKQIIDEQGDRIFG